ncbi:hypothetical protein [Nostoc sp. DedSLP04]|uniref:hypothetical protein n=1 Tax=Nostoc sp. DedSLP04 TaxID=3075401 RepID=UPI002AD4D5DA|nr:hypothetical protein [Nostoc sp. DedSLP04]MDZ8034552.1 hypothetical protein [Nostoc sp. DedSLP04]
MNENDQKKTKKNFEQLQTLGQILSLIQILNIDELEAITTGSHLGEAVKLIKNLKNNLNLAINELEKQEDTISNELPDSEISTQPSNEKNNKNENTKKIIVDYITSVVSTDTESFPDRKSISDFFKEYFDIDYILKKESRKELVNRLCKLVLERNITRDAIGDALLKKTNSKHGSLLKEKETSFLKSWYEAIEKM